MKTLTKQSLSEAIHLSLHKVKDPEIPLVSIVDLGMLTGVEVGEVLTIKITPTFSGCPALDYIKDNIKLVLENEFDMPVKVETDYTTQWNSNLISDAGREALRVFKLAPPAKYGGELSPEDIERVKCPNCGSTKTTMNSPFGSTLCRSIHFCFNCKEGFEKFKEL